MILPSRVCSVSGLGLNSSCTVIFSLGIGTQNSPGDLDSESWEGLGEPIGDTPLAHLFPRSGHLCQSLVRRCPFCSLSFKRKVANWEWKDYLPKGSLEGPVEMEAAAVGHRWSWLPVCPYAGTQDLVRTSRETSGILFSMNHGFFPGFDFKCTFHKAN